VRRPSGRSSKETVKTVAPAAAEGLKHFPIFTVFEGCDSPMYRFKCTTCGAEGERHCAVRQAAQDGMKHEQRRKGHKVILNFLTYGGAGGAPPTYSDGQGGAPFGSR
jgi:hypothetical protein